jgi:hypothetical protein
VVETLEAASRAVDRVTKLSRHECRRVFEERFTAERMARDYLAVYRRVLDSWGDQSAAHGDAADRPLPRALDRSAATAAATAST